MNQNTPPAEGVIRYQLEFTPAAPPDAMETAELRAWFRICRQTGLVGQSPDRYEGVAYGNLSQRIDDQGFLITGTQTSGLDHLEPDQFARVTGFDAAQNKLVANGPCHPSSEAMTHGMIYRQLSGVRAVFHAHCPVIWQNSAGLCLPTTAPDAEYGTPEMAEEVERLLRNPEMSQWGLFSMGGHEDGIVAYGENPRQAGALLISTLAEAMAHERL